VYLCSTQLTSTGPARRVIPRNSKYPSEAPNCKLNKFDIPNKPTDSTPSPKPKPMKPDRINWFLHSLAQTLSHARYSCYQAAATVNFSAFKGKREQQNYAPAGINGNG